MKEKEINEEFARGASFFRIRKCPHCGEKMLFYIAVDANVHGDKQNEKPVGTIEIHVKDVRQGNCRECNSYIIPELEDFIGAEESAYCCADTDADQIPVWTFKEARKGVNKQTRKSIECIEEAEIKDLKCIQFESREEMKKRREKHRHK